LIYLPVVAFTLIGIINFIAGPLEGGLSTIAAYVLGIVLPGYMVLTVVALIHSYVKATPLERSEQGLNFLRLGSVFDHRCTAASRDWIGDCA